MKALLALGAVALVLSGVPAAAKTKTYMISLDGHCDVITLTVNGTLVAGTDASSCEAGIGGGLIGTVKKFGEAIVAGVQFSAKPGTQFVFEIAYPLATGGAWDLYDTTDGVTLTKAESGTYTVEKDAAHMQHGGDPVAANPGR